MMSLKKRIKINTNMKKYLHYLSCKKYYSPQRKRKSKEMKAKLTHCARSITPTIESGMTTLPTTIVSSGTLEIHVNKENNNESQKSNGKFLVCHCEL